MIRKKTISAFCILIFYFLVINNGFAINTNPPKPQNFNYLNEWLAEADLTDFSVCGLTTQSKEEGPHNAICYKQVKVGEIIGNPIPGENPRKWDKLDFYCKLRGLLNEQIALLGDNFEIPKKVVFSCSRKNLNQFIGSLEEYNETQKKQGVYKVSSKALIVIVAKPVNASSIEKAIDLAHFTCVEILLDKLFDELNLVEKRISIHKREAGTTKTIVLSTKKTFYVSGLFPKSAVQNQDLSYTVEFGLRFDDFERSCDLALPQIYVEE